MANQSKTLAATRVTDQEITTSYLKQAKEQMGPHIRINADISQFIIRQYRQCVLDGLFTWDAAISSHYWAEFPRDGAKKHKKAK